MRMLQVLVLLTISITSFANTRVEITPVRPVDCKISNYPSINWIYDIEKINETEKDLEVSLKTSYGFCQDSRIYLVEIMDDLASIDVMKDGITLPFQKAGVKAEIIVNNGNEAEIKLHFDKEILFKKKNHRQVYMTFNPGGFRPVKVGNKIERNIARFEWLIDLDKSSTSMDVKFKIMH